MEQSQLVKEIITTTTERYGDNGNVKEKVTESREKIYSTAYTDEELKKAKPIDKNEKGSSETQVAVREEPKKSSKEDDIKAAVAAIEKHKQEDAIAKNPLDSLPKPNAQDNPYEAWQKQQQVVNAVSGIAQPPQYNVANRLPTPAKFPWEQ